MVFYVLSESEVLPREEDPCEGPSGAQHALLDRGAFRAHGGGGWVLTDAVLFLRLP